VGVDGSWDSAVLSFSEAAAWFARTVASVDDRWSEPGLGEWDVRSLVGHTSRALLTVEAYLARPAASVTVSSPVEYFSATRSLAAGPDVAARGREAGEALGPDPAAVVDEIVARVVPLVSSCSGEELVTTIAGGMRLADYLPTRTFELVAHTTDLASALGLPLDVPPGPALQALELVSALAVAGDLAGPLLRAALGRAGLREGFSVL
jgi:uncharacterized protein (TIGR03083 family)